MNLDAELALLCEAVYLTEWQDVERFIAPDWQLVAPLDVGNTEAMLCRRGAMCSALVFRGTEFSRGVLTDVLANFGSWTLWNGPGSVHAGYWGYVDTIYTAAREAARQVVGAPLYITGHSLGGAAASLYAARMAYDAEPHLIDGLVTFGSPKAFNAESCGVIKAPIRRHVVRGDFAPHWPVNPWLRHCAPAITHEPPSLRMSALARHWIGVYRTVLANEANVA